MFKFNLPPLNEPQQEKIPELGTVKALCEKHLGHANYTEVQRCSDERGLYLYEIRAATDDGFVEYSYIRKGKYPEGSGTETAIHVTFFDENEIPVAGSSIAKLIDGQWQETP